MSRLSFILIGIFFITPGLAGAVPAGVVLKPLKATVQDCQIVLEDRINRKNLSEWSSLPATLNLLNRATILVRLELRGAMPRLSYANQLTGPVTGLEIPDELRVLHESTVAFVAHGESPQLMNLYSRVANSPAAAFASYKIIDYSALHTPLELPKSAISVDGTEDLKIADRSINERRAENASFTVYVLRESRLPIFFFPREQIEGAFDADVLGQLRINAKAIAKRPSSIAGWLNARADAFDKKVILYLEDWALVSLPAFRKLYEVSRIAPTRLPPIDTVLSGALADCFDLSCAALPPSNLREIPAQEDSVAVAASTVGEPPGNEMNAAGRRRVIAYMKAHSGTHSITQPYGIRLVANELGKLIEDERSRAEYRNELRDIAFTTAEYNLLYSGRAAQERFGRFWRAFLKGMGNPYVAEPFTTRNLQKGISLLPD